MPLTVNIEVSQIAGDPATFQLEDISTGSDPGITSRRVYLYDPANNTLVNPGTTTAYTVWDIADDTIEMNVLDRDRALMLIVQWLTGSTVTYTYTNYYVFTAYTNIFLYNLTVTNQLTFPDILKDQQYLFNKLQLYTYLKDAANAIAYGPDISKAQIALDIAQQMMNNSSLYF